MQPVAAALQMWARRHQAQPVPLPARVLVVGNVTVGGTGKTPVVANVAQRLHAWGWRVAVITRGHGAHHGHPRRVGPHDDARHAGDEPVWLAQQLQPLGVPVVAAHDRVAAARLALAEQPGCHWLISDDGLQHHALARDVELLVFDARGVGNGLTLPAGPLREPWPRRADLVLQHGSPQLPDPQPQACFAMQRRLAHTLRPLGAQAPMPLAHWRDQAVQAFAGIGAPQAFFAMLQQAGLKLVRPLALADHAALQQPPSGLHPTLPLVCTAKDAVKASHWPAPWRNRLWVADLEVDCPPAFWTALQRAVSSVSSAHGQTTA
jgi:tetraacyldisaccharide 4'-kinase